MPKNTYHLRTDHQIDSLLSSDNDSTNGSDNTQLALDEFSSTTCCCLVCSILPSLSKINCCSKHLTLLTTLPSLQVLSMNSLRKYTHKKSKRLSPAFKRKIPSKRKKPSNNLRRFSSNHSGESLLSSNRESLLSSSSSSLTILSPTNHKSSQSNPATSTRNLAIKTRKSTRLLSNQSDSSECYPHILLQRVVHVKDDGEDLNMANPSVLNMSEATKQMAFEENPQPKIYLNRIRFEK